MTNTQIPLCGEVDSRGNNQNLYRLPPGRRSTQKVASWSGGCSTPAPRRSTPSGRHVWVNPYGNPGERGTCRVQPYGTCDPEYHMCQGSGPSNVIYKPLKLNTRAAGVAQAHYAGEFDALAEAHLQPRVHSLFRRGIYRKYGTYNKFGLRLGAQLVSSCMVQDPPIGGVCTVQLLTTWHSIASWVPQRAE